jgi:hypothetical protein
MEGESTLPFHWITDSMQSRLQLTFKIEETIMNFMIIIKPSDDNCLTHVPNWSTC